MLQTAGGVGSISGQGTKILYAAWCSQKASFSPGIETSVLLPAALFSCQGYFGRQWVDSSGETAVYLCFLKCPVQMYYENLGGGNLKSF